MVDQQPFTSPLESQAAFTIAETARLLHVSPETVRKMVRKGDLTAVHLTERTVRIPGWSIQERLAPERRVAVVDDGEFA